MEVKVSQYQFDRICGQMEKEYGKIKNGEEDGHMAMLFPLEGNMLKVHREHPKSDSRRAMEAITITLFRIQGYLTGDEYDLGRFQSEENERLVQALLMAFDPFTNRDVKALLENGSVDLGSTEALREVYGEPVRCLLKIRDSIEFWCKKTGADGYFQFIENSVGTAIKQDQKMDFAVMVPGIESGKKSPFGRGIFHSIFRRKG